MPDGSIVLMGGRGPDGIHKNDMWRLTNNGETWTQLPNAEWSGRDYHSSVVMPDGSIVLMGGYDNSSSYKNDTWRSMNNGTTWTRMNASSGWSTRAAHTSVAMPDGSIVLMGGLGDGPY
jgi:type II secretory pathway component GspD/PulD (secretin)